MNHRYLITGAAGQDGLLLSRLLSQQGHVVIGLVRSADQADTLKGYAPAATPVRGDLTDSDHLSHVIRQVQPTRVINLGAISSVRRCEAAPEACRKVNVEAIRVILDVTRRLKHECRVLQASSSLIYEGSSISPQNEGTKRSPVSLYARTKAEAMDLIALERERHGRHVTSATLYNHESPLRSSDFVTRRVSQAVARIRVGLQSKLTIGNLQARRDWGWAPEYAKALVLVLDYEPATDFVLATGITHSIAELVEMAFDVVGLDDWRNLVSTDPDLIREPEVSELCGDSSLARALLEWSPKIGFERVVAEMLTHDLKLLRQPQALWYPG